MVVPSLEFQDIPVHYSPPRTDTTIEVNQHIGNTTHTFGQRQSPSSSDSPTDVETSKSFWSFEYYQQFFDVDTEQVKNRIIWGMIPRPGINYIHNCIQPNPDLYGPFWICITLIFTIAVSGNVVNYLQSEHTKGGYEWRYDFHIVSFAATAIFSYANLVPLFLWGFIKSNNNAQTTITFLELLCLYGYSLGIYVPVSILWAVPISWLQWTLVLVGATLSGFVLLSTISPALEGPKKCVILLVVIGLHFLLAVGFMLYFFHVPTLSTPTTENVTIVHTVKELLNGTKSSSPPKIH